MGSVGLTEPQAREKYGDVVKVCEYTSSFSSLPSYHDAYRQVSLPRTVLLDGAP